MHRNLTRSLWSPLLAAALALSLAPAAVHAACQLNSPTGKIKHVVYVEFDNVHFTRDNPNVPSDLEQMPNLLNFLENNGTLDAGDHAVLISHTANDILTTETGLYSDRDGIAVANNFGVFSPIWLLIHWAWNFLRRSSTGPMRFRTSLRRPAIRFLPCLPRPDRTSPRRGFRSPAPDATWALFRPRISCSSARRSTR